jgi:hypothetical protein
MYQNIWIFPGIRGIPFVSAMVPNFIIDQRPERHIHARTQEFHLWWGLCVATHGFDLDRFLGQGGFGKVGFLDSTNQVGSHASAQWWLQTCLCAKSYDRFVVAISEWIAPAQSRSKTKLIIINSNFLKRTPGAKLINISYIIDVHGIIGYLRSWTEFMVAKFVCTTWEMGHRLPPWFILCRHDIHSKEWRYE